MDKGKIKMLWRKEEAEITLYNHTLYRHMTPALLRYTIVSVLPSPDCAADASSVWMTEVCLPPSTPQSECHSTFAEWPGGGAAAILHTDSLVAAL